jgi:predicted permease
VDPWRERRLQTTDATVIFGSQRSAAATLTAVLGALAFLVLIAAAANVSGVLLARVAGAERASAIHMSLGAVRGVVIRRQLLEGAMVGAVAGMLATALYVWARIQLAEIALLPTLALRLNLPLTPRLIALAMLAGMVSGVVLAIGPAVWAARFDVIQALRDSDARSGTGARLTAMRRVLVSAQVCITLVLIVGATLLLRSLDALSTADLGFPRDRLVALDFDVEPQMTMAGGLAALADEALTRVDRMPQVQAAAMSNRAPVDQSTPIIEVQVPGNDASRTGDVTQYLATQRYFDAVGIRLIAGRTFTAAEVAAAADVVIVNESLAARLWPHSTAVDCALYLPSEARTLRVVGVARDSKYRALTESSRPHVYRPTPPALGLTLLARTRGEPRETLRAIQRELDGVGPGLIGFFPRTLDDHLAVQLLPTRAAARAATVLGVLAWLLSALALYALVAWFVVLHRREIGVRMALGASARDVRTLVVRQAFGAAAPGLVIGAVLAIGLGTAARSAFYGVSPADPVALGVGIVALIVVVLFAGYIPSRVATAIDPASSLRH